MYFLGLKDELTAALTDGVRTLFFGLDRMIYRLIIFLYSLFEGFCNGRILENSTIKSISFKVGLILGIVMLFKVVFSFIQMMINPDLVKDKEKGAFNIIKKVLITIVLLGITPSIFSLAYKVQDILLSNDGDSSNVIARLLLPQSYYFDSSNFGPEFSFEILDVFYHVDSFDGEDEDGLIETCTQYQSLLRQEVNEYQTFSFGLNCLNTKINVSEEVGDEYVMEYNYFLSTITGAMICWILFLYTFSVGVRMVKLAFLQIISPMAIVSYLSFQKDGTFQKWTKMCLSTYLDVFIRVAIINFVVLMISIILDSYNGVGETGFSLFATTTGFVKGSWTERFAIVIIILALLQFGKSAPDLIKELLPKSMTGTGEFGFSLKNREYLGKGMATIGGAATGLTVGALAGKPISGVKKGISKGFGSKGDSLSSVGKSIGDIRKNQSDINRRTIEARKGGSDWVGRSFANLAHNYGFESPGERDTRQIGYMDTYSKFLENMKSRSEDNSTVGELKRAYENAQIQDGESDKDFEARKKALRKTYKNAQKAYITASINGDISARRGFSYEQVEWDSASGSNVSSTVSGATDGGDISYSSQISDMANQANRYQHEHSGAFRGTNLTTVVDYESMENNTNAVNQHKSSVVTSSQYERRQANNKFSGKK